jgi:hypothetical protein
VTSQREVDELTRQKDNIASHLAQVRQLLGSQLGGAVPGMEQAVAAAPAKPAIAESAPAGNAGGMPGPAPAGAVRQAGNGAATAQAQRPVGNGGTGAKEDKPENDEDWWTE